MKWHDYLRIRQEEFLKLGPDWDSYGASPPDAMFLAKAFEWLATLPEPNRSADGLTPPTSVSLTPAGGLEVEWYEDSKLCITIAIEPEV